jgi:hypothetical protein
MSYCLYNCFYLVVFLCDSLFRGNLLGREKLEFFVKLYIEYTERINRE